VPRTRYICTGIFGSGLPALRHISFGASWVGWGIKEEGREGGVVAALLAWHSGERWRAGGLGCREGDQARKQRRTGSERGRGEASSQGRRGGRAGG